MNWHNDKRWADVFMPEIKAVLGMHLLGEAPYEEDSQRATDLIVLRMEPVRIAVRMRKKQYAANADYLQEFTIRCERTSGMKTELRKILSGFGDYFFYGFEAEEKNKLGNWNLIDLNVFREHHSEMQFFLDSGIMPGERKTNFDGSSSFCVFRFQDFPARLVRATGVGVSTPTVAQMKFGF